MKKTKDTALGSVLKMGMTSLVGVGLIGATSSMANSLPTGTAKTITGVVPGLQAASLVGYSLQNPLNKSKSKDSLW